MGKDNVVITKGADDVKREDLPCMNVYEIAKNMAKVPNLNMIGGSTSKGSPIMGGQNGEA